MIIMITLLWVQITGLPLHGALLTGNIPAGADRVTSSLPPELAGLKRKPKIVLGRIFTFYSFTSLS